MFRQVAITEAGASRTGIPEGTILWTRDEDLSKRGVIDTFYSNDGTVYTGLDTVSTRGERAGARFTGVEVPSLSLRRGTTSTSAA